MNKEQASKAYIKDKLRDSREYLGCEEHRRKQLITCDLYDMEQAFEDGWDESEKEVVKKTVGWIIENVHKYISAIGNSGVNFDYIDFICDYRKAMEE